MNSYEYIVLLKNIKFYKLLFVDSDDSMINNFVSLWVNTLKTCRYINILIANFLIMHNISQKRKEEERRKKKK